MALYSLNRRIGMRPRPTLTQLLESSAGTLASSSMIEAEKEGDVVGNDRIRGDLLALAQSLGQAEPAERRKHVDEVVRIAKSVRADLCFYFLLALHAHAPFFTEFVLDEPAVLDRINHLEKMAEMASVFSVDNLRRVRMSVRRAKEKAFA